MRQTAIEALAAHPRRWPALLGLALAVAHIVVPLLAGRTPSITLAAATGVGVGLVFWGVGSLLKRQRSAAGEWASRARGGAGETGPSDGARPKAETGGRGT